MGRWENSQIIFVTGKGGVGKSLIAAGLARLQAQQNRRVLLVEIGENSYYGDFWGLPNVHSQPQKVPGENFELAMWSGESCLREYVVHLLKLERLYKLFFENKIMRTLMRVAPGLSEISILGKVTSGVRHVGPQLSYDCVVIDAYATGHALALFRAPKGLKEAIQVGPMGHQAREIERVLRNSSACQYVVTTLLEELPVQETLEFAQALHELLGAEAMVVANKVQTLPVTAAELKHVQALPLTGAAPEFVTYLGEIEKSQELYLKTLQARFAVAQVPLIFSAHPQVLVRAAAEALRTI